MRTVYSNSLLQISLYKPLHYKWTGELILLETINNLKKLLTSMMVKSQLSKLLSWLFNSDKFMITY